MMTLKLRILLTRLILLVGVAVMAGCASLEESTDPQPLVVPTRYTVEPGDTLYAIAKRFNLNYQNLARLNDLGDSYQIYVGQTLQLVPESTPTEETATPPSASAPKFLTKGVWRWPTQGRVVATFKQQADKKGIIIQGALGQPVTAAAAGKVVYSGSGIVGYGNLLIIQHQQPYLSIYGHNRALLVREGDWVQAGQIIAEMGVDNHKSAILYFELRKDGRPLDPLKLLPQR